MSRRRISSEQKRLRINQRQREYRAKNPLTPAEKARKRERDKARQQTQPYKDKAIAKYRARREAIAAHPRPDICEVCGGPPTRRSLHFDHCHTTLAFRGWLCHRCNTALGYVKDDPALLRKLADYLDRFPRPDGPYRPQETRSVPKMEEPLPLLELL